MAAECADQSPVQSLGECRRKRPSQIGSPQLRPHDPPSANPQCQTAPDSLDLRQFGHRSANQGAQDRHSVTCSTP